MNEQGKEKLERIAESGKNKIGENENSVKYNFIIPLLECFGYYDMDFEHSAQGNRIDIYIEDRGSCGIVVEAKSYDKKLDTYISQLEGYANSKRPLLAILSNGEDFRLYSPFWRIPKFSDTLLYSIKKMDLNNDEIIERLEKLLSKENLENGKSRDHIRERENEIINANDQIKSIIDESKIIEDNISNEIQGLKDKINEINIQIAEEDKKILDLKKKKEEEIRKLKEEYRLPIHGSIIPPDPPPPDPNGEIEIFALYRREIYNATYYSPNKINYNGIEYTSPSAACGAITRANCNGWVFWKFRDENGEHLLSELR